MQFRDLRPPRAVQGIVRFPLWQEQRQLLLVQSEWLPLIQFRDSFIVSGSSFPAVHRSLVVSTQSHAYCSVGSCVAGLCWILWNPYLPIVLGPGARKHGPRKRAKGSSRLQAANVRGVVLT